LSVVAVRTCWRKVPFRLLRAAMKFILRLGPKLFQT
jgi:hypothetical protein